MPPVAANTNGEKLLVSFQSICDWNALPPRLIDRDNIDQFTNEIQQIYKS